MDPAFSLADELDLQRQHDNEEGELQFHPGLDQYDHYGHDFASGSTLEDEFAHAGPSTSHFGATSLDSELEGLHLRGHGTDLASELGGGGGGGSLADELDPSFTPEAMSRHASSAYEDTQPLAMEVSAPTLVVAPSEETLAQTEGFVSQLSLLSATTPGGEGDTAQLEAVATRYLTLLSQCTAEREAQLRELRELERRLDRDLPAFSLPSTSSFTSMPSTSSWASDLSSPPSGHRTSASISTISSDSTLTPPPSTVNLPLVESAAFAPLYTATGSLVGSLTTIHEHTQVTRATSADAARKLKTVRGLVDKWKSDVESVGESEAWIASQTAERGRGGSWVREQVDWCRGRIEEVECRARVLLTPVSLAG
ncbi:hypothetical protein PSEUBRA_001489 [Kalmanozyma brasiliensis GHG001]|uniref:Uncharacterized protein n=1 Tax=Kalmanozyma brasiliensis (strain GHG001) TaxID=1365824 RepID=V5ETY3_KALBG|nr:uncharacterized protein PSEUBRA_001489 [Kalmanozyma brasiliensis GHG001]EST08790.1 hypothetical protein PSEUBRA_001489 [Kalmanozyma brasiliensis GHG001]